MVSGRGKEKVKERSLGAPEHNLVTMVFAEFCAKTPPCACVLCLSRLSACRSQHQHASLVDPEQESVHQGFLPQFNKLLVECLVAGFDLGHLPTLTRIGFDLSVLRVSRACEKEAQPLRQKLSVSSVNLDCLVCEWQATQHHARSAGRGHCPPVNMELTTVSALEQSSHSRASEDGQL